MLKSLDVTIWGRRVGTLAAYVDRHQERVLFYYDRDFAAGRLDIAPLRAPIDGAAARQGLPVFADSGKIYGGLPSFVADSLPDHWGNSVFRRWAGAHGLRLRDLTSIDRLAYIGRRGMGALEFEPPAAEEMERPFRVEVASLHRLALSALDEAAAMRVDLNEGLLVESLFKVGTSAAGRRPKAVLNVNYATGQCYSGQVAAPEPGFTPTIVKFDEQGEVPTTRIEYAYYLMAQRAGLRMMPSRLLGGPGGAAHFLTERFDRRGDDKVHVQTLAAMSPAADSYEALLDAAVRLDIAPAEREQLFLLMAMNVACGNVDDHNKNVSFMMGRDGVWHAAPAYDFTFAVDPSAPAYVNLHSLSVNGAAADIGRGDLLAVASRYAIKGGDALVDQAVAAAADFRAYAREAGLDELWSRRIASEIDRRIARIAR